MLIFLPISLSLPDSEQKEIDFVDTSFFMAGAARQLPTPTQVRALSKDIDTRAQHTPVKYEKLGLLVKFGPHVTTVEALNLWTIKKVFGDDIPVPEVFGWRVDSDGYTFKYMELISGPTLEEAIGDQLSQIMEKLRKLAQDSSERFIGSINRGHLMDYVFIDQPKTGPFLSVRAFNDWFASLHQLRLGHKYDDPTRSLLPDTGDIKLTHGDLNRRNIIVSSTSPVRVVIVDWQQSGWYPDYWEYCKAVFTCWYEDEWRRDYIDRFLHPQTEVYFAFSEYAMAMGAV
ncbi:uncharacterized protein P174DRAFT_463267 [Aspergillus novofumigatus IBT 16806]|uniref:Aminoglycoside phosphotransferase domain-containing protein n=1 Tax=Aspergillus novofumigatus (strain IBT 16806) TaxID=1392255 RepID=A0A2I1C0G8_ASPN1|nr:uncharacterized protein P174DRAFT_463267 [Aspergillus novofumigatus IBT 16806]PKX91128.1 hypothetical protein P174DRAFT_463267 [Aspergillus novofumigatus IBT 16806]